MRFNPHPSVLAVPLGPRAGSYVAARNVDHEVYAAELRDNPHFRDRALEIAAVAGERESNRYRLGDAIPEALRALIARPAAAAAISLGMHPYTPYLALRHGRRGNLIDHMSASWRPGEAVAMKNQSPGKLECPKGRTLGTSHGDGSISTASRSKSRSPNSSGKG